MKTLTTHKRTHMVSIQLNRRHFFQGDMARATIPAAAEAARKQSSHSSSTLASQQHPETRPYTAKPTRSAKV